MRMASGCKRRASLVRTKPRVAHRFGLQPTELLDVGRIHKGNHRVACREVECGRIEQVVEVFVWEVDDIAAVESHDIRGYPEHPNCQIWQLTAKFGI